MGPLTLLLPLPLPPLPSDTPVLDTPVSDMLVSDTPELTATLVLDTATTWGRPRLSPRLMLTTATELTPTPELTATLVLATLPPTATATVWEPTELTELTTVKLVQLSSRSSTQSLLSVLLLKELDILCCQERKNL